MYARTHTKADCAAKRKEMDGQSHIPGLLPKHHLPLVCPRIGSTDPAVGDGFMVVLAGVQIERGGRTQRCLARAQAATESPTPYGCGLNVKRTGLLHALSSPPNHPQQQTEHSGKFVLSWLMLFAARSTPPSYRHEGSSNSSTWHGVVPFVCNHRRTGRRCVHAGAVRAAQRGST